MKGRENKSSYRMGTSGSRRVNEEDEVVWIWPRCFIYMYENRTSPVEIVQRREGNEGE
jgi:hypothetical protein